ncbi:MAG: DHH family phosphoesterase [Clostridia bacterium]|nr:DHH family phosphoesterase [Clostridia bacterium]
MEISELFDALYARDNFLFVGHSHPDGDCVGSGVALCALFAALGKKTSLFFPEPPPRRLAFLTGGAPLFDRLPADLADYTVVCEDIGAETQFGDSRDALAGKAFARIDHHDVGSPYAALEFVRPQASATGEIVYALVRCAIERGLLPSFPVELAAPIYAAVSSDTGCFKYANVTPDTHRIAAELISLSIPSGEINRLLFDTKDEAQIRAEGIVARKMRTWFDGALCGVAITEDDYAGGLVMSDFETAVDIVRCLAGVRCGFVAKASPGRNAFRVSFRGNGGLNVACLAQKFGGGGHLAAAGCTIETGDEDEVLRTVVSAYGQVYGGKVEPADLSAPTARPAPVDRTAMDNAHTP